MMLTALTNPDARRAVRAIIDAFVHVALVVLLYILTDKLAGNPDQLLSVARGALIIVGLGAVFYGSENVTRAFRISGPLGLGAEFDRDAASQAADTVAGAAVGAAAVVKGAAQ